MCESKYRAVEGGGRRWKAVKGGECRVIAPTSTAFHRPRPVCGPSVVIFREPFPRTIRVSKSTLSVTDNRTGKTYELPIQDGTIRAVDLRQIKVTDDDAGLATYDPGFLNTAACRSAISYIDGDKGILRYRGYPIEQLAERSTFLETAYLLLHGELPSAAELDSWVYAVTHHTIVHESIKKFIDGFHHDANSTLTTSRTCRPAPWRASARGTPAPTRRWRLRPPPCTDRSTAAPTRKC